MMDQKKQKQIISAIREIGDRLSTAAIDPHHIMEDRIKLAELRDALETLTHEQQEVFHNLNTLVQSIQSVDEATAGLEQKRIAIEKSVVSLEKLKAGLEINERMFHRESELDREIRELRDSYSKLREQTAPLIEGYSTLESEEKIVSELKNKLVGDLEYVTNTIKATTKEITDIQNLKKNLEIPIRELEDAGKKSEEARERQNKLKQEKETIEKEIEENNRGKKRTESLSLLLESAQGKKRELAAEMQALEKHLSVVDKELKQQQEELRYIRQEQSDVKQKKVDLEIKSKNLLEALDSVAKLEDSVAKEKDGVERITKETKKRREDVLRTELEVKYHKDALDEVMKSMEE